MAIAWIWFALFCFTACCPVVSLFVVGVRGGFSFLCVLLKRVSVDCPTHAEHEASLQSPDVVVCALPVFCALAARVFVS